MIPTKKKNFLNSSHSPNSHSFFSLFLSLRLLCGRQQRISSKSSSSKSTIKWSVSTNLLTTPSSSTNTSSGTRTKWIKSTSSNPNRLKKQLVYRIQICQHSLHPHSRISFALCALSLPPRLTICLASKQSANHAGGHSLLKK